MADSQNPPRHVRNEADAGTLFFRKIAGLTLKEGHEASHYAGIIRAPSGLPTESTHVCRMRMQGTGFSVTILNGALSQDWSQYKGPRADPEDRPYLQDLGVTQLPREQIWNKEVFAAEGYGQVFLRQTRIAADEGHAYYIAVGLTLNPQDCDFDETLVDVGGRNTASMRAIDNASIVANGMQPGQVIALPIIQLKPDSGYLDRVGIPSTLHLDVIDQQRRVRDAVVTPQQMRPPEQVELLNQVKNSRQDD